MRQVLISLLALLLFLSGPAMKVNDDFRHSTLAADTGAANIANGARLNTQLTADEIAGGHAFDKHVIQAGEFPGITTRSEFSSQIENVINNASDVKILSKGRSAYLDSSSGTVVIRNPSAADGGTIFKPTQGKTYFDNLK
jgi:filamentous hemagglutinin